MLPPAIRLAEAPLRWSVHSVTLPVHVSDASGNDLPAEIKRPASYASVCGRPCCGESDPGPAGIPAGYHREVPACSLPFVLQKRGIRA